MELAWESILAVSAAWKPLPTRFGPKYDNKRLIELQKLAHWLVVSCGKQGLGATLAWLKKASSGARLHALTGEAVPHATRFLIRKILLGDSRRDSLDQLAFLGRSLPAGDDLVKSRALIAHREVMMSKPTVDSALLRSARDFGQFFAKKCLRRTDLQEMISPTPSASFSSTRRNGGTREESRREHRRWISTLPQEMWNRPDAMLFQDYSDYLSPAEVESDRMHKGSVDVARAAAWRTATYPLRNRVTCVPERGWKQRIVSAPEAHVTVAGTCLNKALLRAVSRWGPCAAFLAGDRRGAVETVIGATSPHDVIVSTDLTAATDRLPHDLIFAIVSGIVDGWDGLPDLWSEALFALTGPQVLSYPWGQEITSSCGILMGLGPSWPVMSVIHAWWMEISCFSVGEHPSRWMKSAAIGGDDLIARWPRKMVESYRKIVAATNGKVSVGKDFTSSSGGNFTEMSFYVVPGVPGLVWSRAIPVKGLVGSSIDEIGASFESLGSDPGRTCRGRRVLVAIQPSAWQRCRDVRVSPALPRSLGGAGLPSRKGSVARIDIPLRQRLALGKFLYGAGQDTVPFGPPSWVEAGDPSSWEARQRAELRLTEALEFGVLSYSTLPYSRGSANQRLVVDQLSDQVAWYARSRVFSDHSFPPVATEIVSLSKYSRLVNGWISKKIRGGVPGALALTNRRNSRFSLLGRARLNRDRWSVLADDQFPIHVSEIVSWTPPVVEVPVRYSRKRPQEVNVSS
ncbi:RNA-dependent RNA polymerase [Erysiphe necator associated narnavirus 16]|nr:RNA-dependent RNA polymerase [Erysiphe necator associated narnavirus 16]